MKNYKKVITVTVLFLMLSISNASADILTAAEQGDLEQVKLILKENPELINLKDAQGYTPLHEAAYNNRAEVVKYLINAGADINAKSNSGSTPLHGAAYGGHLDAARVLLENGADFSISNSGGYNLKQDSMVYRGHGLDIGNIDGDGDPDLFISNFEGGSCEVWFNEL